MISVIIPTYNMANTITKCVESILNQSYSNFEIIIVDDGSSDGSSEICDELNKKDERIKVIHQKNSGAAIARAEGYNNAKGEWILFVDSDDTLPSTALNDLVQYANNDTDIVFGNGYTINKSGLIDINEFRHLTVRAEGTIGVPWGSLYRKDIIEKSFFIVPREIVNGEDYIFWLRLIFNTQKPVSVVEKKVYNKGTEHISSNFKWTAEYTEKIQELRMQSIPEKDRKIYFKDTIYDRIANLFAVSVCQSKKIWKKSKFYKDIVEDMKKENMEFSKKQKLFLNIPSLILRKSFIYFQKILQQ